MADKTDYSAWSQENLIQRVTQLEKELHSKYKSTLLPTSVEKSSKKARPEKTFDPSKYSTRLIALKFAYLGKKYNGFEYHAGHETPLPTIEEELWKAFNKARLIFPKGSSPLDPGEVNWEGCEYSKCGRTDKGVSAFGQVIGIRVRSNRPLGKHKESVLGDGEETAGKLEHASSAEAISDPEAFNTLPREHAMELASPPLQPTRLEEDGFPQLDSDESDIEETLNFDPITDEIQYATLLNRLLPPDIRILAWCPAPPLDFSARFSCRERRYRYFFTQPAFNPTPHNLEQGTTTRIKDGWLDIDAMKEAAKLFEGLHDFRNFCKVDSSKQIENFERRIFHADIVEVEDQSGEMAFMNGPDLAPTPPITGSPKVYTFDLHGSAFLWHQVRCMVSVLFLVGQGLEAPSIISELLDVKKNPRRPLYEMATDTPLVLWDCIFPSEDDAERKDALVWHYVGDQPGFGDTKYGTQGLMDNLWEVWKERKIDEMLAGSLMGVVAKQGLPIPLLSSNVTERRGVRSQKVFDGGNVPRLQGRYTPVMKKPRLETVEAINEKYAIKKGFESAEDLKIQGFRRLNLKPQPPIDTLDE
ncbi:pseudouridine synthase-1 [Coleophoma cylindrospora]|uniref:Pseudouridine synthase-1 n=1 Tax=Coleophoma cylindrospora TaxID=1849047 RepID=A0A3D8QT01_9HELO|nr:pseudouridine synthase-1 [Coleophoma cylindrospora]